MVCIRPAIATKLSLVSLSLLVLLSISTSGHRVEARLAPAVHFVSHYSQTVKQPTHHTSRVVALKTESIHTTTHAPFHTDDEHQSFTSKFDEEREHQYLVHVKSHMKRNELLELQDQIGKHFNAYMPHNTYLLVGTEEVARKALDANHVMWVGAFKPKHKYLPELEESFSNYEFANPSLLVVSLPPESMIPVQQRRTLADAQSIARVWIDEAMAEGLNSKGLESIQAVSADFITVQLSADVQVHAIVSFFAERPESHWLEIGGVYETHNYYAARVILDNDVSDTLDVLNNLGPLNGSGQIVGLADGGLAYASCYLNDTSVPSSTFNASARKIVRYISSLGDTIDFDGHGTHVGGTIAGYTIDTDSDSIKGNGIAPGAKIHFSDLSTTDVLNIPTDLSTTILKPANDDGARIFVIPWGSGNTTSYTSQAQNIDTFSVTNPGTLVIISAGNNGYGDKTTNNTRLSLTNEAVSKNALVVGSSMSSLDGILQGSDADPSVVIPGVASYNSETLSTFSSRGPTSDGRLKPDIVAVGESISSADYAQTCGHVALMGTSQSAAVVGGAAAILRQYFALGYYPLGSPAAQAQFTSDATLTSSLIKAMLIHAGQPLKLQQTNTSFSGITYPGNGQGFGRIQLDQILFYSTANSSSTVSLAVYSGSGSTPAATLLSGDNAQRYCVEATSSTTYFKFTLYWNDPAGSPASTIAAINDLDLVVIDVNGKEWRSVTSNTGQFDQFNNVEQVIITLPVPGYYKAYVHPTKIADANTQDYTLVITSDASQDHIFSLCDDGFNTVNSTIQCPLGCSGANGICGTGDQPDVCVCNDGFSGVDCSIVSCPNDCSSHGVCNTALGECACSSGWTGLDCSDSETTTTTNGTVTIVNKSTSNGVSTAMFAGVVVAAFIVGTVCSVVVGGFIAVKYLEYRRDQIAKKNDDNTNSNL